MNNIVLQLYRLLAAVCLLMLSFYHAVYNHDPTLYYFTNWGIYLTAITYTLLAYATFKSWFSSPPDHNASQNQVNLYNDNFYSPWLNWKWSIFFYETSVTFEIMITIFFWGVLFPIMLSDGDTPDMFTFIDHIMPIVILTIDYTMNRIPF